MRTERGRSRSCLYMRRTSAPALLRKRSTCSRSRIKARLSLRKWPDPVSAHPQRGVWRFVIVLPAVDVSGRGYDFRKQTSPQPFGESCAVGRRGKPGLSAALLQIAREQRVDDSARDEIMSIHGCALETAVLNEHERARPQRAAEPRSEAVGGQVPCFRKRGRARHRLRRPDRNLAIFKRARDRRT